MIHERATAISVAMAVMTGLAAWNAPQAVAAEEPPRVEYLVKSVDFDITTHYSSGPNVKTESSGQIKMVVHTSSIHNHPRDILFLVVELNGYDAQDKDVPINPSADKPSPERQDLPLYDRRNGVVCEIFFDAPWPARRQRVFELEAPVSGRVLTEVRALSYTTYAVGYEATNAVALLGDPVLREDMRAEVARWLSKAVQRRYRYLTDDGMWILSKEISDALPLALAEEQTTKPVLIYSGVADKGPEIAVRNKSQREKVIRVAGGGRARWLRLAAQKEAILEVDAGLLAITIIQGHSYVTHTALIKSNANYALDLD